MKNHLNNLRLQQTQEALVPWQATRVSLRPLGGWIRAIRCSLGMTVSALARRLLMTPAAVRQLEKSEVKDVITLASLKKLAQAMDCDLRYTLIPRKPLDQILEDRALSVAHERLQTVSRSMKLEGQGVEGLSEEAQVKLLAKELLDGSRRELW